MKKYESPILAVIEVDEKDIISTSPGTSTSIQDESDGIWNLDVGNIMSYNTRLNILLTMVFFAYGLLFAILLLAISFPATRPRTKPLGLFGLLSEK